MTDTNQETNQGLGENQNQANQNTANDGEIANLKAEIERLRKHNETLLGEKKAESEKRKAEQAEKDKQAEELARKKGDFETLEKQYQNKIADLENQIAERDKQRDADLVKSHAQKLASSLSDNPNNQAILEQLLEKRLIAKDGQIKVVDDSGAMSIASLDDLKNEFVSSGRYDSLITGTRASGTGSSGTQANKKPQDYSETERIKLANDNPTLFNQLFGA